MLRHRPVPPLVVLLAACALGLLAAPAVESQSKGRTSPNIGLNEAGRTDAGEWDGTWYYVNRGERWVMWLRTRPDGLPEMKLRYLNLDKAEAFITDWTPQGEYVYRSLPGSFRIDLTERDANVIKGAWKWEYGIEGRALHRQETARITMYRAGDGRSLVMRFEGFERVYKTPKNEVKIDPPLSIAFLKASRRQAHWDELPF